MTKRRNKSAISTIYNNIHFKSMLEVDCYKLFEEHDLPLEYETTPFTLLTSLKPTKIKIYLPSRKTKNRKTINLKLSTGILQDTVYTPDFYLKYKDYYIFIETKGRANDVYPLKKKLFFHLLESLAKKNGENYVFFEPHNKTQILETIKIIKEEL